MNKELTLKNWDERALRNLMDVNNILNESGINFWLDYGTLLGAIREGKLNDWMKDIDLGIMNRDWNEFTSIFPKFKENGFLIKIKKFFINDLFFRMVKISRDGVFIDFSVYRVVGNYAIDLHDELYSIVPRSVTIPFKILQIPFHIFDLPNAIKNNDNLFTRYLYVLPSKSKMPSSYVARWFQGWTIYYYNKVSRKSLEKLNNIKLHGIQFNIPSNVENYLRHIYGIDWRIPKKHYKQCKNSGSYRVILSRNNITV